MKNITDLSEEIRSVSYTSIVVVVFRLNVLAGMNDIEDSDEVTLGVLLSTDSPDVRQCGARCAKQPRRFRPIQSLDLWFYYLVSHKSSSLSGRDLFPRRLCRDRFIPTQILNKFILHLLGIFFNILRLEVHHGVDLLRGVSQKSLQVTHKPIHVAFSRRFQDNVFVVVISQSSR